MRFFTVLLAAAFANEDETAAPSHLPTADIFVQSRPNHCDTSAKLVQDGCKALSQGVSEAELTLQQLVTALEGHLDEDEVLELAGFHGWPTAEPIDCEKLCHSLVGFYTNLLPWKADVGCVTGNAGPQCDIDLAPEAISQGEMKELDDKEDVTKPDHSGKGREAPRPLIDRVDAASRQMLRMFRSYPWQAMEVELEEGAAEPEVTGVKLSKEEAHVRELDGAPATANSFLQLRSGAQSTAWSLACMHHQTFREHSGVCPPGLTSKQALLQLERNEHAFGLPKTAFVDFDEHAPLTEDDRQDAFEFPSFVQAKDVTYVYYHATDEPGCLATCQYPGVSAGVEGCESCKPAIFQNSAALPAGDIPPLGVQARIDARPGHVVPQWRKDVERINVKAQAYVKKVLMGMESGSYSAELTKWFGTQYSMDAVRTKVTKTLKSLEAMLDNVGYIYPGRECSPNTYAYVYPGGPKSISSKTGKFLFFLCDVYMRVGEGEKVETLTHEGSHHRQAYTDDVDGPRGGTAYGRSTCRELAQTQRPFQSHALNNADNYCYFINDAAER